MTKFFRGTMPLLAASLALSTLSSTAQDVTSQAAAPPATTWVNFGLIAGQTATNTGVSTLVTGSLAVSPGNTAPGFLGANVTGTINLANGAAGTGQSDATTAYLGLAGQACDLDLTGQNLGGLTLTPGVYCFSSSAQLTGTLTLNGLGNAGAVWIFKVASALTTASGSSVIFTNSGQSCGAFWAIGSSATLGTTTSFGGNIFSVLSITMNNGATNSGGLYAQAAGAVTLDTNQVQAVGTCGGGVQPPAPTPLPTPTPAPVPALPDFAAGGLLAMLLVTGAIVLSRR